MIERRRAVRALVAASVVAAVPLLAQLEPWAQPVTTLPASADAFVTAGTPDAARGGSDVLRVVGAEKVAYVRFDVPEVGAGDAIRAAVLRLHAHGASRCDRGVEVLRAAGDGWDESSISWSDQPGSVGGVLAASAWTDAGYVEFDVTPAVTGAGPVTLVVRQAEGCDVSAGDFFGSREADPSRQPQLVLETVAATGQPPRPAACSDGLDNDGDGRTDHPADPGCADAADGNESEASAGTVVVATAGDVACDPRASNADGSNPDVCQHRATADLLAGADAVLPLGDLQYPDGTLEQFLGSYDPTWGVHAPVSYPVTGNHEYHVPGARGYFDYWQAEGRPTGGAGAGYYSFDVGSWHLIALNSNCSEVACDEGSTQNEWLERDLAATDRSCVLAYWHHPLFNSGVVHGDSSPSGVRALWEDLYAAGADLIVNGHEHNYQRYAKQDPDGGATADGIREFVAGTGGARLYGLQSAKDPNYEAGEASTFGVLRLHLDEGAYSWEFVSIDGTVLDSGGPVPCN